MPQRAHVLLLAAVLLCVLGPAATTAEPEATHAPFTVELWPNGTPTAMQPKSEATEKLFQSYGGKQPNRVTDVTQLGGRRQSSGASEVKRKW